MIKRNGCSRVTRRWLCSCLCNDKPLLSVRFAHNSPRRLYFLFLSLTRLSPHSLPSTRARNVLPITELILGRPVSTGPDYASSYQFSYVDAESILHCGADFSRKGIPISLRNKVSGDFSFEDRGMPAVESAKPRLKHRSACRAVRTCPGAARRVDVPAHADSSIGTKTTKSVGANSIVLAMLGDAYMASVEMCDSSGAAAPRTSHPFEELSR